MELDRVEPLLGASAATALADASVLYDGRPLVLRLDDAIHLAPSEIEEAAATLRKAATVTVLLGDPAQAPAALVDAVDVCLTSRPDAASPWVSAPVGRLVESVADSPQASLALVALLRTAEALPVWGAVAAEAATYGLLLGSTEYRRWLERRGPASPSPTTGPPVVLTRTGPILTVELDRPEVRNAFDSGLRDGLVEALAVAAVDPSISEVHLRGRGQSFSAGGDLAEFGSVPDPATSLAVRLTCHPGHAVHEVQDRTTAWLHGACVGAGIEVPAFAGRVIADPSATFRLPEVSMGLVPGAGGTVSIARRIGRQRTAWWALVAEPMGADTAMRWGLVDDLASRPTWPEQ